MGSIFSRSHRESIDASSPATKSGLRIVTKTSKKNAVYVMLLKDADTSSGHGGAVVLDVSLDLRLFDRQVASLLDDHGVRGSDMNPGDVLFGLNGLSTPAAQKVLTYLSSPEFGKKVVEAMVDSPPPFSSSFGMDDAELRSLDQVRLSVADSGDEAAVGPVSSEDEFGNVDAKSNFPRVRRQPKCLVRHDTETDALTVRLPSVMVTPSLPVRSGGGREDDKKRLPLDFHAAVVMAHNLSLAFPHGLVPILDPETLNIEKLTERLDLDVTTVSLSAHSSHSSHRQSESFETSEQQQPSPSVKARGSLLSRLPFVGTKKGGGGKGSKKNKNEHVHGGLAGVRR